MPRPTPFHGSTAKHCLSYSWKDWAGFAAVCRYDLSHEYEYYVIRHKTALIDVSPLFKYRIKGPDAGALLARICSKDVRQLKVDQVTYLCWCDDRGFLMDDGTVTRISEDEFILTAAEPTFFWLKQNRRNYQADIADISDELGALSVQGPTSRSMLVALAGESLAELKFFRSCSVTIGGIPVRISRTGYTGDLGYEIWVNSNQAEALYNIIVADGAAFGAAPVGMDAMDMARIEAGFIMNGVDYYSSNHCLIDARKSTPYEAGLGWTVKLDRDPFIGQAALRKEKARGPKRKLVGLEVDWVELEERFSRHGLPPETACGAWRSAVPLYDRDGDFVGQATSGTWSPVLKKNIALATVPSRFGTIGTELQFEITVEYRRETIRSTVVKTPFFDPERKRS